MVKRWSAEITKETVYSRRDLTPGTFAKLVEDLADGILALKTGEKK